LGLLPPSFSISLKVKPNFLPEIWREAWLARLAIQNLTAGNSRWLPARGVRDAGIGCKE
jgi:hypothetical protein